MTSRMHPPRGYRQQEYPLPHSFGYAFSLHGEDETKNSTICTMFKATEVMTGMDAIEVNPRHPSFAEDVGTSIHMGSIVPKLTVTIAAYLTKGAIETDKMRALKFNWMPIYSSFLDSLEAEDIKTATQVEDTLELTHETTNKDTFPLFSTVKLSAPGSGLHPFSTVGHTEVFGDMGLAASGVLESVAFDKEEFYDNLQFKTNKGMLGKVAGNMKSITVLRDRPYRYFSNNFTQPSVKRGNPFTFCGILFHLPQGGATDQLFAVGETTAIPHLTIGVQVRFNEWHPSFDQDPF